jgi:hypothetical protein
VLAAGLLAITFAAPAQANHPTGGPVPLLKVSAAVNQIRIISYGGLNGHKDGKPDVTPAQLHHDIVQLAKKTDLITVTEIVTQQRENALRLPGWGVCRPAGNDPGYLYRKALLTSLSCADYSVSKVKYYSNMGHRWVLPPKLTVGQLQVKATGMKVQVSVAHTISCAFSRDPHKTWIAPNELCTNGRMTSNRAYINANAQRPEAYKAFMAGWQRVDEQLIQTFHPDVDITAGDFNLDFKQDWVRKYLSSVWKDSAISWQRWAKYDYTHLMETYRGTHKVLLDGLLVSGEDVSFRHVSEAFPEMVSSDHSPSECVIRLGG